MIGSETIDRVIGQDVIDESGSKIGSASEVYLDDETGQPEWVTVRTGLFGTKETFIPIRDADLTDDGLRVPLSKDRVKDAPRIDAEGHLSPEEEQELYRYYGLGGSAAEQQQMAGNQQMGGSRQMSGDQQTAGNRQMGGDQQMAGSADRGAGRTGTGRAQARFGTAETTAGTGHAGAVGRDTSGPTTDSAMTRSEERLSVGTRTEESGRARLRKYVVTENVTRTVPVSHEEVRVEREPITEATMGDAMAGPGISEEEHEVTLHAERPVVDKQTVPVERVRLDTQTVTGQEEVDADLQREEIEVDGDPATGRTTRS